MAHNIAAHYTDELQGWLKHIDLYNGEMFQLEEKLSDIIRRNSIPEIADKVEDEQHKLDTVRDKFYRLQLLISHQEEMLRTDGSLIDDDKISSETDRQQNEIREHMLETEKEYIQVKFNCQEFIRDILKQY